MTALTGSGRLPQLVRPMSVSLAAATFYGSWAALVHLSLGHHAALNAGLTQAALSVSATLPLGLVLESLFRWQPNPLRGFWFAFVGTSVAGAAWLAVGHTLAGTPHVAVAIAPSLVIGTVFFFGYARALLRQATREAVPAGSLQG
jgi:hypothetical protein